MTMANWIKVLNTLPRCKAIYALMRALHCKRHAAIGLAVDWLCWLDVNSTNGETGMLDDEISDVLGWQGAAEALSAVGWVSHDEQGYVVAVDFDKHNGETAKKRAEDAERQRKSRGKRDKCHGKSVTDVTAETRPDKIREDIENGSPGGEPKEAAGRDKVAQAMNPDAEPAPKGRGARPESAEVVKAYLAQVSNTLPFLNPQDRDKAAQAFFDEMESVGWIDKQGRNVWNWQAAARRFAAKWADNLNSPFRNGQPATGSMMSLNKGTFNDRDHSDYDKI